MTLDRFFWAAGDSPQAGNLIARIFQGKDKTYFCQKFKYDDHNNIEQEELWGNLTGKSQPLEIDKWGNPKNGCEKYTKQFVSSKDNWNLPKWEDDGRKSIHSFYYKKSNLLKCRLTSGGHKIIKREFFEYDANGTVIKEIWDDGISTEQEDLAWVSERHLRITTPSKVFPVGLPEVVDEYFLDHLKNYRLLKKVKNTYNPQGKITSQAHYGSDKKLAYELKWEYDKLGNVNEYVDALGQTTLYKYDLNGNKLLEQGPRQDFHKEFEYDYANRLIQEKEIWATGQGQQCEAYVKQRFKYMTSLGMPQSMRKAA